MLGSRLSLGFFYVSISLLSSLCGAESNKAVSQSVAAEKVIQSIPEEEIKRLEKDSVEGASSTELNETQKTLLAHFKNANPVKVSGLEVHLLKVNREMHLTPPSRDVNYNYELIYSEPSTNSGVENGSGKVSNDKPSATSRHLVLLTIRSYQNGSVDYALASRPEGPSAQEETSAPAENLNPTWWSNAKSYLVRDGFLVLAFCIPLFMFIAAFICFRARPPWRLFWLLFIFVGIFKINMNWSTGAISVSPLQLIYFGFQVKQSFIEGVGPGPWVVSISFPVGALAYLIMHRYRGPHHENKVQHLK